MYVAYKRGEDPAPKKVPRKKSAKQLYDEKVQEMAQELIAKWRRRDRIKALKSMGYRLILKNQSKIKAQCGNTEPV